MDEGVNTCKGDPLPTPCWLKPVSTKASTGATCAQVGADLESPPVMSMKTAPLSLILNSGIPYRIHSKKSFWLLQKKEKYI